MNWGNGAMVASRGRDWGGFDGFAIRNAPEYTGEWPWLWKLPNLSLETLQALRDPQKVQFIPGASTT